MHLFHLISLVNWPRAKWHNSVVGEIFEYVLKLEFMRYKVLWSLMFKRKFKNDILSKLCKNAYGYFQFRATSVHFMFKKYLKVVVKNINTNL